MSHRPIAHSPDLLRLQNEGYDLVIRGGYLLVRDVPFVDARRTVQRGTLIVKLDLSGDIANKPPDHVAYWIGEHPCHSDGTKIHSIENGSPPQDLGHGTRADFLFSAKADYRDYHHKVTTYVGRIAGEAAKLDPSATACTFPEIPAEDGDIVFRYIDTASSRSGITAVNSRARGKRIGIVGLGGSGGYVLDLVAKTEVAEIHIFDGDVFSQHNAFRSPGAPTLQQLAERPHKVCHFASIYGSMHRGIVVHDAFIDESNLGLLGGLDFCFVCVDRGQSKRRIVERLTENSTPFIEVGIGVLLGDGQLGGLVRVTTSTADTRRMAAPHISFATDEFGENEYTTNIQIAELNALSAVLAVIRWKKLLGIYRDARDEYNAGFSIATGEIAVEGLR